MPSEWNTAVSAEGTKMPTVDVLIPVYNAARTLVQSVKTIQDQSVKDIRIIIIDDGSTDVSLPLIKEIAANDPRVLTLEKKRNSGIVDSLNLGLAQCTAHLIARHDADDLADPNRFDRQINYLEEHPDCIAVSSFARHIDSAGAPLGSIATFLQPEAANMFSIPSREPYLLHPFLMARRSSILAVGGYRYVHHAEDTDLYWRLQEIGRLHNLEEVLGAYRFSSQSITSRSILNGRISAIYSQLAAISAQRRRSGRPDIDFDHRMIACMEADATAIGICQLASRSLDQAEADYLKAAYAGKLLELASYRPYELDLADCRFIATALKAVDAPLANVDVESIRRWRAIAIARFMRHAHLRRALTLINRPVLFQSAWRLAGQFIARMLPRRLRRGIREFRAARMMK